MTLAIGTAPFGSRPAGCFNYDPQPPEHVPHVEPSPRRVRVLLGGRTVADSTRVQLLQPPHQTGRVPVPARGRPRPARAERADCERSGARRGDVLGGARGRRRGRGRGVRVRVAAGAGRDGAGAGRVRLGGHGRVVRGRRGGLRPPARHLPPHRRAAQFAPRRRALGRRGRRRVGPAADADRDRAAGPLVPAAGGRPHRPARAELHHHAVPVQGRRPVLDTSRRRLREARCRVELPEPMHDAQAVKGLLCFFHERLELTVDGAR
jgi:hypothetical protein